MPLGENAKKGMIIKMKKSYKVLLITGAILLVLGVAIAFAVIAKNGFQMEKFGNTLEREKKTYNVTEKVTAIDVSAVFDDVKIITTSGDFKVEFYDCEKAPCTVGNDDGTLKIKQENNKEWFDYIGFSFGKDDEDIRIYVPSDYGKISEMAISSVSGDVVIDSCQKLKKLALTTVSGEIEVKNTDAEKLSVSTVSGDIELGEMSCDKVTLSTTSGDIEAEKFTFDTLKGETVSGDIGLDEVSGKKITFSTTSGEVEADVLTSETLNIESISGDVKLDAADAQEIEIKTTSGNIEGSLTRETEFRCKSVSGDVKVPYGSGSDGVCHAESTSGDIKFKIS